MHVYCKYQWLSSRALHVEIISLYGICWLEPAHHHSRELRHSPNVGHITPKWDKSGDFSDQIQYILAHRVKRYWIWSKKKSPDLSHKFWDNLTHFWTKSETGELKSYPSTTVKRKTAHIFDVCWGVGVSKNRVGRRWCGCSRRVGNWYTRGRSFCGLHNRVLKIDRLGNERHQSKYM